MAANTGPKIILCDCMGSQRIDAEAIERASGVTCSKVYTALCTLQMAEAATALEQGNALIACQQERQRFEELADEIDAEPLGFVDLRDRAGWTDGTENPGPKMAALAAEAVLEVPAAKTMDVTSEGLCLILGPAEVALKAAEDLKDILSVTVLLSDAADLPISRGYEAVVGRLAAATGSLGRFEVTLDGLQEMIPGGRGTPTLTPPQNGAQSECDIILDLRGQPPLFSADKKRDGYVRADPRSLPAVSEAILKASQMVGLYEKPFYVRMETSLCAHSRAEKAACSNCLSVCPTGAISSAGDHVVVDPAICAGCGGCAAVCPSGAISYDAPPVSALFRRLETLASTYRKAGGAAPRLLVTDEDHGPEMVSLAARFGRGLPGDVIPMAVSALAGFGHAEMLAALASGFSGVTVLLSPETERDALDRELALAKSMSGKGHVALLDVTDPDALSEALYGPGEEGAEGEAVASPILPMGSRRQVARVAAKALNPEAEVLALPEGAPYGAVQVDLDACTLCLSCVSLCPSGALGDNPDMPQLRFQEDACLQCGLCANICPEKAITLAPQLNLKDDAFTQKVVKEEEPFACIECGALFGVKSTVERIVEKLAGKHSMFANETASRMIQMCDDCRVNAQYHQENNPFTGGERPKPRTTDDYFADMSKRKDH